MIVFGGDYEHVKDIGLKNKDGEIVYRPTHVQEFFDLVLGKQQFEATEFSLANYMLYRGNDDHWVTAVPVFPSRVFRHGHVAVRKSSDITDFSRLKGKKLGVRDYSQTAAVWIRGLLKDEYGVDWRDIEWVSIAGQRFDAPKGVKLTTTPRDLEDLLIAGEIDALMMWPLRDNAKPADQQQLRTLLPDPAAAERRYFERTGIFPIMHTVVMRNEALAKSPWAPQAIFEAYVAGKQSGLERCGVKNFFPWKDGPWRSQPAFAGDSHPYGLSEINRRAAGMLAGYLWDQGFLKHEIELDEVFAPGSGSWRG